MKYFRNDIINELGISTDQITISNGSRSSRAVSKIYDKSMKKIFETTRVWKGVVTLNKTEIAEIKASLQETDQN
jgi:hypothetical protein